MKKSFILYTDIYDSIKSLPDLEKGRLLTAIFEYVINGKEISTDNTTGMAFSFIKKTLDRDTKKWKIIRKVRKIAGRLGGLKRAENEVLLRTKSSKIKQKQANQAVSVSVSVSDSVTNKDSLDEQNKEITPIPIRSLISKFNSKYNTRLLNFGKQGHAIKQILKIYSEEDIWNCADWLYSQPFWQNKGFDFTIIASQLSKFMMTKNKPKSNWDLTA